MRRVSSRWTRQLVAAVAAVVVLASLVALAIHRPGSSVAVTTAASSRTAASGPRSGIDTGSGTTNQAATTAPGTTVPPAATPPLVTAGSGPTPPPNQPGSGPPTTRTLAGPTTTVDLGPGPTVVDVQMHQTMKVTSTLVGPPPTPPGQLCPCNPVNGAPLGGAGEPGAVVTGHVHDTAGNPLPDICIELAYVTEPVAFVRTDATGTWHYEFPGLGSHPMLWLTYTECHATSPGWDFPATFFTMYAFNSGLTITIDATAQRAVAVRGVLVNALGQPVPDAPVAASGTGGDGHYGQKATTDAEGRFSFFGFSAGQVTVGYYTQIYGATDPTDTNFGRGSVTVMLSPGETRTVTVPTT